MKKHRTMLAIAAVILMTALLAACGSAGVEAESAPLLAVPFAGEEVIPPRPAKDFDLIDSNGESLRLKDLKGKYVLVGFAYTSCPDVCSLLFNLFWKIQNEIGDAVPENVELVFITIDPEVDTPERLAKHTVRYEGKWHFLTDEMDEMEEVWKDFGIYVSKTGKSVDHNMNTYLLDPNGLFRLVYGGLPPVAAIVSDMHQLGAISQ
jgi:protein SCO1/2